MMRIRTLGRLFSTAILFVLLTASHWSEAAQLPVNAGVETAAEGKPVGTLYLKNNSDYVAYVWVNGSFVGNVPPATTRFAVNDGFVTPGGRAVSNWVSAGTNAVQVVVAWTDGKNTNWYSEISLSGNAMHEAKVWFGGPLLLNDLDREFAEQIRGGQGGGPTDLLKDKQNLVDDEIPNRDSAPVSNAPGRNLSPLDAAVGASRGSNAGSNTVANSNPNGLSPLGAAVGAMRSTASSSSSAKDGKPPVITRRGQIASDTPPAKPKPSKPKISKAFVGTFRFTEPSETFYTGHQEGDGTPYTYAAREHYLVISENGACSIRYEDVGTGKPRDSFSALGPLQGTAVQLSEDALQITFDGIRIPIRAQLMEMDSIKLDDTFYRGKFQKIR